MKNLQFIPTILATIVVAKRGDDKITKEMNQQLTLMPPVGTKTPANIPNSNKDKVRTKRRPEQVVKSY